MPLPVAGEVHRLATLHCQSGYAAHLMAIRDAAVREGPVVVVLPAPKAETTTTTVPKIASQGKARGFGVIIGRPLPADWVPDDQLRAKVLADFGMTAGDINTELPAFHALNAQNGTLSRDWGSTFYLYAKRWKERAARAAPRVELSKAPVPTATQPYEPTEAEWDKTVRFYAASGRWTHQFGPDPTLPACRCPPHLLEKRLPKRAEIPVLRMVAERASMPKVTA